MKPRLEPVLSHWVRAVWPAIAPWIATFEARFPPWWRFGDPRGKCEARDAQLWLVKDGNTVKGAVITQITVDGARVAEVPVVVGDDIESWLHLLDDLEAWARREGCVAMISTAARDGWVRVLKDRGWRKTAVQMERRL